MKTVSTNCYNHLNISTYNRMTMVKELKMTQKKFGNRTFKSEIKVCEVIDHFAYESEGILGPRTCLKCHKLFDRHDGSLYDDDNNELKDHLEEHGILVIGYNKN